MPLSHRENACAGMNSRAWIQCMRTVAAAAKPTGRCSLRMGHTLGSRACTPRDLGLGGKVGISKSGCLCPNIRLYVLSSAPPGVCVPCAELANLMSVCQGPWTLLSFSGKCSRRAGPHQSCPSQPRHASQGRCCFDPPPPAHGLWWVVHASSLPPLQQHCQERAGSARLPESCTLQSPAHAIFVRRPAEPADQPQQHSRPCCHHPEQSRQALKPARMTAQARSDHQGAAPFRGQWKHLAWELCQSCQLQSDQATRELHTHAKSPNADIPPLSQAPVRFAVRRRGSGSHLGHLYLHKDA